MALLTCLHGVFSWCLWSRQNREQLQFTCCQHSADVQYIYPWSNATSWPSHIGMRVNDMCWSTVAAHPIVRNLRCAQSCRLNIFCHDNDYFRQGRRWNFLLHCVYFKTPGSVQVLNALQVTGRMISEMAAVHPGKFGTEVHNADIAGFILHDPCRKDKNFPSLETSGQLWCHMISKK